MSALKNRHSQQLICSLSGTRGLNIICVNKGHIFREQSRKNCDGGLKYVNGMVGHFTCTSSDQPSKRAVHYAVYTLSWSLYSNSIVP